MWLARLCVSRGQPWCARRRCCCCCCCIDHSSCIHNAHAPFTQHTHARTHAHVRTHTKHARSHTHTLAATQRGRPGGVRQCLLWGQPGVPGHATQPVGALAGMLRARARPRAPVPRSEAHVARVCLHAGHRAAPQRRLRGAGRSRGRCQLQLAAPLRALPMPPATSASRSCTALPAPSPPPTPLRRPAATQRRCTRSSSSWPTWCCTGRRRCTRWQSRRRRAGTAGSFTASSRARCARRAPHAGGGQLVGVLCAPAWAVLRGCCVCGVWPWCRASLLVAALPLPRPKHNTSCLPPPPPASINTE
jgi:hypothetical protein